MINIRGADFPDVEIPLIYIEDDGIIITQQNFFLPVLGSITEATSDITSFEPEPLAFDMARSSGTLDFWNDPKEDIYTSEDEQPV